MEVVTLETHACIKKGGKMFQEKDRQNIANNNQAFYSQASWGRLKMKPHEPKKQGQNKSEKEGGKQWAIKNQIKKKRKGNKTLSQKNEKGWEKNLTKMAIKKLGAF
jgi:hypothetical protein